MYRCSSVLWLADEMSPGGSSLPRCQHRLYNLKALASLLSLHLRLALTDSWYKTCETQEGQKRKQASTNTYTRKSRTLDLTIWAQWRVAALHDTSHTGTALWDYRFKSLFKSSTEHAGGELVKPSAGLMVKSWIFVLSNKFIFKSRLVNSGL